VKRVGRKESFFGREGDYSLGEVRGIVLPNGASLPQRYSVFTTQKEGGFPVAKRGISELVVRFGSRKRAIPWDC